MRRLHNVHLFSSLYIDVWHDMTLFFCLCTESEHFYFSSAQQFIINRRNTELKLFGNKVSKKCSSFCVHSHCVHEEYAKKRKKNQYHIFCSQNIRFIYLLILIEHLIIIFHFLFEVLWKFSIAINIFLLTW